MRIIKIALISFCLNAGMPAMAAEQLPLGNLAKADFSREFALPAGGQELLGGKAGRLYFATKDGGVVVTGLDGAVLMSLQAKDAKGNAILKKPRSVTIGSGLLYVVDGSLNQVVMFNAKGEYQGSFGAGLDMGQAAGVATHEGIVYVLDKSEKRIQMFGSNGVYISALELRPAAGGKPAKGQEESHLLQSPVDIQVDIRGQIYVLDAEDLIKVYKPSGEFVKTLPKNGRLSAFAVAQDGVYMVDRDNLYIQKFGFDDKPMYRFGSKGKDKAQFQSVTGLALVKDRQVVIGDKAKGVASVFVADAGESLEVIPKPITRRFVQWMGEYPITATKLVSDGGELLYGINEDEKAVVRYKNGAVDAQFKSKEIAPVGIALDKSGGLWVLDDKKSRVVKLDDKGNIVSSFGSSGRGAGQFSDPTDIVISATGRVYVSDSGSDKVQVFNSEGIFQNEIVKLDNPAEISVSPQETLFVLEEEKVSIYSQQGELLGSFGKEKDDEAKGNLEEPKDILATVDEVMVLDGNLVKVYTHKGKYLRSFGIKGKDRGELNEPISIARKDEVTFYIAEAENKRTQTFVTQYKPSAPQQLSAEAGVHAIRLRWADPGLPYIKQYAVYRSKEEGTGFVRIATSTENEYIDRGLEADGKYFYRVGGETVMGYEGASSALVSAAARKFAPPQVAEIKVEPGPWQLKMTWKPIESEYLSSYRVYQKEGEAFNKVGEAVTAEFVIGGLSPNTKYTYYVAAFSKDGLESEKVSVSATTALFTKAPLEIEIVKLRDIFSNSYKIYEQDGVGVVRLTNNTDKPMEGVKLGFTLKDFMDYATETNVGMLQPQQSVEIPLKAVFNNNILTVTEDSSVQTMLEASYFENSKPVVFTKNPTIKVYEKHKLLWDERERYASFVTPKDPPLVAFTRSIITQYSDVKDESLLASVIFNAIGTLGLTYVHDPSNPYQLIGAGNTNVVDYIQFPRETLMHKAGDCDDLVAFYSAALESIGIETRILEVPEHMLMMFSTGIPAESDGWNNDDMYVIYEGKLWIPVETTLVGNKFVTAWEKGAETYYKWAGKGLTILDVHTAWSTFKPASLPEIKDKPGEVKKADIDKKFPTEFSAMLKISSNAKTHRYREAIEANPNDAEAYQQIGIIMAKMGDVKEAKKYFDKTISLDPSNASALNNRGNIMMIEDRYAEAAEAYQKAAEANPNDPYIWVNLAKAHRGNKDIASAKKAFNKAKEIDPEIKKKYRALGLELQSSMVE